MYMDTMLIFGIDISGYMVPFINDKDLFGEPAPGRRFKGVVWMQGVINFPDDNLSFEDL